MRKGFFVKFRVPGIIPTFHSCRSKDPSSLPTNPVPSFPQHSSTATATTIHHKLNHFVKTPPPRPKLRRFSLKSHVSSAFSSARRGCLKSSRLSPEPSHTQPPTTPLPSPFTCHVNINAKVPPSDHQNYDSTPPRRKVYNSDASDTEHENDVVLLPPPPSKTRPKKNTHTRRRRRRTPLTSAGISTSSDSGLFSEDDTDDQTLISSDSPVSPFSRRRRCRHLSKSKSSRRSSVDLSSQVPARLSEFMRRMAPCREVANGKVRESFAIVKRSEEPYEDFKRSMAEMVVENQMFEERELEELLRCFLSLNSERHHQAIVRAFTEIWKGLFCHSSSSSSSKQ